MERLKDPRYFGHVLKMLQSFLHIHVQNVSNALILVLHPQCFIIVSGAAAHFTIHPHVRKEVHLDFVKAVTVTGFTPATFDVEAESARLVASHL